MSDSNPEIDQLIADLIATRKEIDREIGDLSVHWVIRPLSISIVRPNTIALLYGAFLIICFSLGIVFTFLKGTLVSLGVSLVVGALFVGGAVAGQVWGFAVQERNYLFEKAFGAERTKGLEDLGEKYW